MTKELTKRIKDAIEKQDPKKMGYSRWCPYTKGISHSFISKWLGCRERARLGSVEGWRPKGFQVSLEFGNIFHLMKEFYYTDYVGQVSFDRVFNVADEYVKSRILNNALSGNETKDLERLSSLCKVTFKEYIKYWKTTTWDADDLYTDDKTNWVSCEEEFTVPYRIPNNSVVRLTGMIDGTFMHPATGAPMILENKTKSRIEKEQFSELLAEDNQTLMYTLCYYLKKGVLPQGTLYNIIRVSAMKPHKNESAADYAERVGADIRSRPDHYFMRWETTIDMSDLDRYMQRTLNPILIGIVKWWESIKKNPQCPFENEDGSPNQEHWVRPFGMFSGGIKDIANDFKEIVLYGDYSNFELRDD
jgi:hypothetical protein